MSRRRERRNRVANIDTLLGEHTGNPEKKSSPIRKKRSAARRAANSPVNTPIRSDIREEYQKRPIEESPLILIKAKYTYEYMIKVLKFKEKKKKKCYCGNNISTLSEEYIEFYKDKVNELKSQSSALSKGIRDNDLSKLRDILEDIVLDFDDINVIDRMADDNNIEITPCCLREIFHSISNDDKHREVYSIDMLENPELPRKDIKIHVYPKCPSCGVPISKYLFHIEDLINKRNFSFKEAFDELNIMNACCRKTLFIGVIFPENKAKRELIDPEYKNQLLAAEKEPMEKLLPQPFEEGKDEGKALILALEERKRKMDDLVNRGVLIPNHPKDIQRYGEIVPVGNGLFTLVIKNSRYCE